MATKVEDVHIIWIVEGLGCEGDTISVTAATQPSIEDIVLGAIPGLPRVHIHNKCIAYEWGKDFMEWWYKAERGELDPFVLVFEGSVPNEKIKSEGYWSGLGVNPATNQPIPVTEWIDRLAPKALAVVAAALKMFFRSWLWFRFSPRMKTGFLLLRRVTVPPVCARRSDRSCCRSSAARSCVDCTPALRLHGARADRRAR